MGWRVGLRLLLLLEATREKALLRLGLVLLCRRPRLSLLHLLFSLGGLLACGLELLLSRLELGLRSLDLLLLLHLLEHLGELLSGDAAERLLLLLLLLVLLEQHLLLLHLLLVCGRLLRLRLALLAESVQEVELSLGIAAVVGVLGLVHHLGQAGEDALVQHAQRSRACGRVGVIRHERLGLLLRLLRLLLLRHLARPSTERSKVKRRIEGSSHVRSWSWMLGWDRAVLTGRRVLSGETRLRIGRERTCRRAESRETASGRGRQVVDIVAAATVATMVRLLLLLVLVAPAGRRVGLSKDVDLGRRRSSDRARTRAGRQGGNRARHR